jgi:hypothetical protein
MVRARLRNPEIHRINKQKKDLMYYGLTRKNK